MQKLSIRKIVSGGQTGADRAALDFALENEFEIGGFVPKGRLAEDGKIPAKYINLSETEATVYAVRTELNVENSDATMIFSQGNLEGGSLLTRKLAEKYDKPFLHINFRKENFKQAVIKARKFLLSGNFQTLNVAGPRASEDAQIYQKTKKILSEIFSA